MSTSRATVVSTDPTSTTNMTGLRTMVRGIELADRIEEGGPDDAGLAQAT